MTHRILVTGVGGRSVGAGILHSLTRSSAEVASRWHVIAADCDPFSWGLYKVKDRVLLPPASSPNYVEVLEKLVRSKKIDAVIPGTQPEVEALAPYASAFPSVVICNKAELLPLMLDKMRLFDCLKELGLPSIPTVALGEEQSLVREFGFPLVVKPSVESGGSKEVYLVHREEDLAQLRARISPHFKPCVQAFIGSGDSEYTVGVLSDKNAKIIDSIVMKRKLVGLSLAHKSSFKAKEFSISSGYSQGFIVKAPKIQSFCESLAERLGSCGPLNIQLRVHNNEPYVFEIHPRFSGTTPIRADVGFNEVDVLLQNHLLGKSFGRLGYRTEVASIRAFEHVIVPLSEMKDPSL